MTSKFNWRWAFSTSDQSVTVENRQRVVDAMYGWSSEWTIDTEGMWITRVEDEDGDCVWDCEFNDVDEIDNCFSDHFLQWMDTQFSSGKKKVVVGNATKLPLPGDSPLSSSKGVAPLLFSNL